MMDMLTKWQGGKPVWKHGQTTETVHPALRRICGSHKIESITGAVNDEIQLVITGKTCSYMVRMYPEIEQEIRQIAR